MSYSIEGTIKTINEPEHFNSGFYKQSIILLTTGEYPQELKFDFHREKSLILKDLQPNTRAKVHFDIRGRPSPNGHFIDLLGWRITQDRDIK